MSLRLFITIFGIRDPWRTGKTCPHKKLCFLRHPIVYFQRFSHFVQFSSYTALVSRLYILFIWQPLIFKRCNIISSPLWINLASLCHIIYNNNVIPHSRRIYYVHQVYQFNNSYYTTFSSDLLRKPSGNNCWFYPKKPSE